MYIQKRQREEISLDKISLSSANNGIDITVIPDQDKLDRIKVYVILHHLNGGKWFSEDEFYQLFDRAINSSKYEDKKKDDEIKELKKQLKDEKAQAQRYLDRLNKVLDIVQ